MIGGDRRIGHYLKKELENLNKKKESIFKIKQKQTTSKKKITPGEYNAELFSLHVKQTDLGNRINKYKVRMDEIKKQTHILYFEIRKNTENVNFFYSSLYKLLTTKNTTERGDEEKNILKEIDKEFESWKGKHSDERDLLGQETYIETQIPIEEKELKEISKQISELKRKIEKDSRNRTTVPRNTITEAAHSGPAAGSGGWGSGGSGQETLKTPLIQQYVV